MSQPKDTFGFGELAKPASEPPIDISRFKPEESSADDEREVQAARRVAVSDGFTARTTPAKPSRRPAAPAANKGRVRISEVIETRADKRADEPRTQLNITTPVSVARRFKALEQSTGLKAWELLEQLMERPQ